MSTLAKPVAAPDAILLRESEVARMVGFSRRTIRSWVSAGKFPKPVRIGDDEQRSPKRWKRSEVDAWIAKLPEAKS